MMRIKKPSPMYQGSKLSLVAPAFHFDIALFRSGTQNLEKTYELQTVFDKNVFKKDHYFAGSDKRRLQELYRALTDTTTQGVLAIRGGYGVAKIYPELIKKLKRTRNLKPKIVAGYSDLTILLNGLYQELGWITFHSPVLVGRPFQNPKRLEKQSFYQTLFTSKPLGAIEHPKMRCLVPGKATAPIVGGCLSLVVASIGTPYEIKTNGKILFLEDVAEAAYKLDRMLTQLVHSGMLDGVKGIVFGQMENCKPKEKIKKALLSGLDPLLKQKKFPVIFQFPAGHGNPQMTFPIGVKVKMISNPKKSKVIFLESGTQNA